MQLTTQVHNWIGYDKVTDIRINALIRTHTNTHHTYKCIFNACKQVHSVAKFTLHETNLVASGNHNIEYESMVAASLVFIQP